MDAAEIKKLDQMERRLVENLEYSVRNGYYGDAEKRSRILVNIAMYRRLKAGLKGGFTPPPEEGTVMAGPTDEMLDSLEVEAAGLLEGRLANSSYESAERLARVLANLALYRRLRSGDKMRIRADGSADIVEAPR